MKSIHVQYSGKFSSLKNSSFIISHVHVELYGGINWHVPKDYKLLDMGSVHVRIEELFYNTCSYVILQATCSTCIIIKECIIAI